MSRAPVTIKNARLFVSGNLATFLDVQSTEVLPNGGGLIVRAKFKELGPEPIRDWAAIKSISGFQFSGEFVQTAVQKAVTEDWYQRALLEDARRREAVLKSMLGRWVSELEPALAERQGTFEILGLTVADDPAGAIVVAYDPALDGPQ